MFERFVLVKDEPDEFCRAEDSAGGLLPCVLVPWVNVTPQLLGLSSGCSIFENCKRCNNGTWGPRDNFFIGGEYCSECRPGWSGGDCMSKSLHSLFSSTYSHLDTELYCMSFPSLLIYVLCCVGKSPCA